VVSRKRKRRFDCCACYPVALEVGVSLIGRYALSSMSGACYRRTSVFGLCGLYLTSPTEEQASCIARQCSSRLNDATDRELYYSLRIIENRFFRKKSVSLLLASRLRI